MPLRQTFFLLKALKPPLTSNEKKKTLSVAFFDYTGKYEKYIITNYQQRKGEWRSPEEERKKKKKKKGKS